MPRPSRFSSALSINEKALGPEHPTTAKSLNNLAGVYDSMGDYAQGRATLPARLENQ